MPGLEAAKVTQGGQQGPAETLWKQHTLGPHRPGGPGRPSWPAWAAGGSELRWEWAGVLAAEGLWGGDVPGAPSSGGTWGTGAPARGPRRPAGHALTRPRPAAR